MAGEFFGNVDSVLAGIAPAGAPVAAVAGAPAAPAATGQVFTAPARAASTGSRQEFLTGVAVGAGLVVLGVIVGGIFGRRR